MEKKLYYKIGEACRALDIQPYVLRYWETEFAALSPSKSKSGQRVYTERELGIIRRIKELLYDEGYTIAGAKKRLEGEMTGGGPAPRATPAPPAPARPAASAPSRKPPAAPPSAAAAPPTPAAASPAPPSLPTTTAAARSDRLAALERGIEAAVAEARDLLASLARGPRRGS